MSDSVHDKSVSIVEVVTSIVAAAAAEHLTEESEPAFVYEIATESQDDEGAA